jgi:hypothetical protein
MVMRRRSGEAILGAEIVMLGRVRMTRQAQRVGTAGEKLQKVGAIGGVGPGVVRVEIIAQRDVHRRNDQFVGRRFLEHVGDERQLPLADAAFVKARRITVDPIKLVVDIIATCTFPRFIEAPNSQPSAIRKNEGFSSVIDPEGHMLCNLDRARLSSVIGNNDFGGLRTQTQYALAPSDALASAESGRRAPR